MRARPNWRFKATATHYEGGMRKRRDSSRHLHKWKPLCFDFVICQAELGAVCGAMCHILWQACKIMKMKNAHKNIEGFDSI